MKKVTQNFNPSEKDIEVDKNLEIDKFKTTNVNILLNRVRLDRQRTLKKRIVTQLLLISTGKRTLSILSGMTQQDLLSSSHLLVGGDMTYLNNWVDTESVSSQI